MDHEAHVPGVSEDEDKAAELAEGEVRLHPVDLGAFPGEELKLVVDFFALRPEALRIG